jgi:hypothetical protein
MCKRLTLEEFIEKAIKIHGDKFDYSKVNYINSKTKINIKCNKCYYLFKQKPSNHLNGQGCPVCAGLKIDTLIFIEKSKKIHGDKFDYFNTNYINCDTKVDLFCKICKIDFIQKPIDNLQGHGCRNCAHIALTKKETKSQEQFIKEAKLIHGDKYNYSKVIYINSLKKIIIICTECNFYFKQNPNTHLRGHGCPKCAGNVKKTKEDFIREANIVHNNKYNYIGDYINARTPTLIECPKHGVFKQIPDNHLNGKGCKLCSNNISKVEEEWLNYLNIPNEYRNNILYINNRIIKPDAFDITTNTIYEFYGDYYHGHPKLDPNKINHKNKITLGELYQRTILRENFLKAAGYNIISIWESDWKELKRRLKN